MLLKLILALLFCPSLTEEFCPSLTEEELQGVKKRMMIQSKYII
jgi:hypothetical protein